MLFPSKVRLIDKSVDIDASCDVCECGIESIAHCFRDCSFGRLIWFISGLNVGSIECVSFSEWFKKVFNFLSPNDLSWFCWLCRSIWKHRNDVVWNSCFKRPEIITKICATKKTEWELTRGVSGW